MIRLCHTPPAKLWLGLLMLSLGASLPAQPLSAVQKLQDDLAGMQSLQAEFRQLTLDDQQQVLQESAGTVQLKKPLKYRWQVQSPYEQQVISDGHSQWIYDLDLQQVTVQAVAQSLQDSPAALLSGDLAQLEQQYQVQRWVAPEQVRYRLTPQRSDQTHFTAIELLLTAQQLSSIRIEDALGQITVIELYQLRTNVPLDDSLFVLQVPAGVDVVEQLQ